MVGNIEKVLKLNLNSIAEKTVESDSLENEEIIEKSDQIKKETN